jgi:hypothetical protein
MTVPDRRMRERTRPFMWRRRSARTVIRPSFDRELALTDLEAIARQP